MLLLLISCPTPSVAIGACLVIRLTVERDFEEPCLSKGTAQRAVAGLPKNPNDNCLPRTLARNECTQLEVNVAQN